MNAVGSHPCASCATLVDLVRPLRSILALADFSPKSNNAVARAALLAREHGTSLHLLHVVAPRRSVAAALRRPKRDPARLALDQAELALAALAGRVAALHGVDATFSVEAGDPLHAILDKARGADLVVLAAQRSNPLRDFVLRTPTERLLRMLQRPLLIVKRPALARYAGTLVPAADASRGGRLLEPTPGRSADDGEELAVVAKHRQAAMAAFLLGRLAQRLVADAACDVLLLPNAVAPRTARPAHDRSRGDTRAIVAPSRDRPKPA